MREDTLDPTTRHRWSTTDQQLKRYLADRPATTRRAYLADWRRWCTWCCLNDATVLPARPEDVALYLASAALPASEAGASMNSPATIARWSGAIAAAHAAHDLPTPTTQEPAAKVLSAVRKSSAPRVLRTRTLTDHEFARILDELPAADTWPEAVTHQRDRLVLTLGRATGLPPDEILDLRVNAVRLEEPTLLSVQAATGPVYCPADDPTSPPRQTWESFQQWRQLLDLADAGGHTALRRAWNDEDTTGSLPPAALQERPGGDHAIQPRSDDAWLIRRVYRGGKIASTRPSTQLVKQLVRTYASKASLEVDDLNAFSLRRQEH